MLSRKQTKRICALAVIIIAMLATIVFPATAEAKTQTKSKSSKTHVVIFSMPRVTWKVLEQANTPHIDKLVSRGSVAAMSVRTLGPVTTPAEGYATISAGNRAAAVDSSQSSFLAPTEVFDGDIASSLFRDQRGTTSIKNPAALGVGFEISRRANARQLYDSKIGSLANALEDHGKSIAAFGNTDTCTTDSTGCFERSIGYVATNSNGVMQYGDISRDLLNPVTPGETTQLSLNKKVVESKARKSIKDHDVTVVECSDLERVEMARRRTKTDISNGDFKEAIENCDSMIGNIMKSVSLSRDQVYVLAPSAPRTQEQTTVFIAAGKSIPKGFASSATTRREGVVTLVDIAPTILRTLHVPLPRAVGETLLDWRKDSSSSHSRVDKLVRLNDQAIVRDKSIAPATLLLVYLVVLSVLIAMAAYTRAKSWRSMARFVTLMSAMIPTLGFLIKPITTDIKTPFRMVLVLFFLSLICATALFKAGKKWGFVKVILAIASINLFVQFADIIFGGSLQFNTVFGYSPIVAGRFAGYGNQAFAIVAISAVIVVAMVKEIATTKSWNEKHLNAYIIAFLVVVLIADGAPYFGSDVGGVLALTPTIFVIGLMLYNRRIGVKAFLISAIVTVGAITTFAFVDLARPASQRTHLGRFAESLVKGQAGVVIERKIAANLRILTASVYAVIVVAALLYLTFLFLHPDRFLKRTHEAHPGFRYLAYPGIIVGVLGMVLNDSGVAIPGMMLAVALPAVTLLALGTAEEEKVQKTKVQKT
jgi:hypothetical protein